MFRNGGAAPNLYGSPGSLVTVLDYCLITGSGWLKPIPNTGSYPAQPTTMSYACYKQPSGAGMTLFVNDGAPYAGTSALGREAWATGWESLTSLSSSVTNSVGMGVNPFPTSSQMTTMGSPFMHVNIRKSATFDATNARAWLMFADSSSFMFFTQPGDSANVWNGFMFGDFYSFKSGSVDAYRCMIIGRGIENSSAAESEGMDTLQNMTLGTTGLFIDRSFNSSVLSVTGSRHGDGIKGSTSQFNGNLPFPNSTDTGIYMSPVWLVESGAPLNQNVRGMMRGLYQPLHAAANFTDGQVFSGSADFDGKTFYVIFKSANNGVYIIETSDTLLTN
jgi:hypothetical protein